MGTPRSYSPSTTSYGFVASSLSTPETPCPISKTKTSSEFVTELKNTEDPTKAFSGLRAQLISAGNEGRINSLQMNCEILKNIGKELADIHPPRSRMKFSLDLGDYISAIESKTTDEFKYRTGQHKPGECPLDKLPGLTESLLCVIYLIRHKNGRYNEKVIQIFNGLLKSITEEDNEWGKNIRLAGEKLSHQLSHIFKVSTFKPDQKAPEFVKRSEPISIPRAPTPCIR